jgi:hypothetical protein
MPTKAEAGTWLTPEQVAQLEAYSEQGLARPAEFDDVVFDNTRPQGGGYRWRTEGEKKAADEDSKASAESQAAYHKAREAARVEAATRPPVMAPVTDEGAPTAAPVPTSTPSTSSASR